MYTERVRGVLAGVVSQSSSGEAAVALAEEFGFEAIVWLRCSVQCGLRGDPSGAQAWELTAVACARKAAHFGAMVLDRSQSGGGR